MMKQGIVVISKPEYKILHIKYLFIYVMVLFRRGIGLIKPLCKEIKENARIHSLIIYTHDKSKKCCPPPE